jgi:hypothetical protein
VSARSLVTKEVDLEAFAYAIARNECGAKEDVETILRQEGISKDVFLVLAEDKVFQQSVQRYVKELTENGASFQLKARLQAEDLLKRQWFLIHDPDTPPAVAVKAIENTVRWAGLEPKTSSQNQNTSQGPGFQIIFNLNSPKPEKIIESVAIEAT